MSTLRLRSTMWFGSGLAVALIMITVFVGMRATAAPLSTESTFVPVVPCRLFDSRPAPDNVGTKKTPFSAGATLIKVTGSNGECKGASSIPSNATAVAMNVTIVGPTASSFLQMYPADASRPARGSNLNWVAGQAPTANKVDVKLSSTGSIRVYNNSGRVDALADIVGYYTSSGIADLVVSIAANKTAIAAKANTSTVNSALAGKANVNDVYPKSQVYTKTEVDNLVGASGGTVVRSVPFSASALSTSTGTAIGNPVVQRPAGLYWKDSATDSDLPNDKASFTMRQPADWTGTGDVTITLFFKANDPEVLDTTDQVRFQAELYTASAGEALVPPPVEYNSDAEVVVEDQAGEVTMTIPSTDLSADWWNIYLQRIAPDANRYTGELIVLGVDVTYTATS